MAEEAVIYRSDHVLEYPYVRSVGPVVGAFLTGLRDGKVVGIRGSGRAGHRAADRVRPRDGGGDRRRGRGRARGHGHLVVLGGRTRGPSTPCRSPSPGCWCSFDGADTVVPPRAAGGGARRGLDRHARPPRVRARGRAGRPRQGHQPLRGRREVRRERARAGDDDGGDHPPRLRLHGRRGHEQEPARVRAGQVHRAALPEVQEGLRPLAGLVPDRRRAHRRDRRAAQHGHRHHLLRRQRALRRPVDRDPLHLRARSCSTGPTSRSWASSRRSRPTRSAWACGSRPCGSPPEELGPTLASVKYFRPTGEPDADYETYKEYL